MKLCSWLSGLVLAFGVITAVNGVAEYKRCAGDINNLWIDIVLVIDNSAISNLNGVYDTMKGMFGPNVTIGPDQKKQPRTTRVAIVTYSDESNVEADFDKLTSLDQLYAKLDKLNKAGKTSSFDALLDLGLQEANHLITRSNNIRERSNYKKLIVVFTSNYAYQDSRPDVLAQSIRGTGVYISTVYTGEDTTGNVQRMLSFVGNYNMNFHMKDTTPIVQELQNATTIVNCYCPNGWYQYESPRNSDNFFAVCVGSLNDKGYQTEAQKACHQEKGGYLATEFDKNKRAFNYYTLTNGGSTTVNSYYNGLMSVNGSWYWDQPKGQPMLPLDPSSGTVPATSGCIADVKFSDGSIAWTSVSCGNRFPYLCEMAACDTDNYCL